MRRYWQTVPESPLSPQRFRTLSFFASKGIGKPELDRIVSRLTHQRAEASTKERGDYGCLLSASVY